MAQIPAILYAAKSTADPHESVESQARHVREELLRESDRPRSGQPVGTREVVGEFSERAVSGYRKPRGPELKAALAAAVAAADEHGRSELWVFKSDRLSRGSGLKGEPQCLLDIFSDMRRQGVTLRSVMDDNMITDSRLIGIQDSLNHEYSKTLGAHVARGKREQLRTGRRLGGPIPDGYVVRAALDEHNRVTGRTYHKDPARQTALDQLFDLAHDGLSPAAIARTLNAAGHRTASGRAFTRARVAATLRNPFYAGGIAHLRSASWRAKSGAAAEEINWEGKHDAYITRAEFARNQLLIPRDESSRRGGRRPKTNFALAKLAVCDRCGGPMFAYTSPYVRNDGTRQRAYVCGNVHVATGVCDAPKIPAEVVDAAVVDHLNHLFLDFDAWVASRASAATSRRAGLERDLAVLLRETASAADLEAKLLAGYTDAVAQSDPAQRAALLAYEAHLAKRDAAQARIRGLQEELAREPDDVGMDEQLDFHNRLARAVRGGDEDLAAVDLNDRLRAVFEEFRLGVVDEGVIGVLPVLREDVVERYVDAPPVAYGADGTKPALTLPTASPLVLFANGDGDLSKRDSTLGRRTGEPCGS